MRFRNTLAIAILFAALGAYLYFYEAPKLGEGAKHLFPDVEVDDVEEVALAYPEKGTEILLKKIDGEWRMAKPIDDEADQEAVKNLVRAVVEAELKRTLEEKPESLAAFGLEKPAARVTLTLAGGKKLPIVEVGKTSPVGWSTFIRVEGSDQVRLVPSAFHYGMNREVKDLRDKTVVEFDEKDVKAIEVAGTDPPFKLAREDSGWRIAEPQALPADAAEVRSFLSTLETLRATDFHDKPGSLDEFGLEKPRRSIILVIGKDGAKKELQIGGEREQESKRELYLKLAGGETVFAVAAPTWTSLDRELSDFRDKTVLAFERQQLGAVEVLREDGETYRLRKQEAEAKPAPASTAGTPTPAAAKEPAWVLEGAEDSKTVQIKQLVGDLHSLKGYEIAATDASDLARFGLDQPELRFTLFDDSGKKIGAILVANTEAATENEDGAASSKASYAMAEGADLVLRIRDYVYSHLDKKREDFAAAEATTAEEPTPAH